MATPVAEVARQARLRDAILDLDGEARALAGIARRCAGDDAALAVANPWLRSCERVSMLLSVTAEADDATWWEAVRRVWLWLVYPRGRYRAWVSVWGARPASRALVMRPSEQRALAKFPPVLTVYRGYAGEHWQGMSWTTLRATAVYMAGFHGKDGTKASSVARGTVTTSDVLALFTRVLDKAAPQIRPVELVLPPDAVDLIDIEIAGGAT